MKTMAGNFSLSTLTLALLTLGAGSAAAEPYLAGAASDGLYVIDASGAEPILHGPFLAGTFAQAEEIELLSEPPALLVRTSTQLHRVELSSPLAPAVSATLTPPFAPEALILAGRRDYSLVTGNGRELAVIDNVTLAIRRTFTMPSVRHEGVLSPDGRLLVSFRNGNPSIAAFFSAFDPVSGLGAETQLTGIYSSFNDPWAFFSPDGRTMGLVQNRYFFDLTRGPAYHSPEIDVYERTGPAQLAMRDFLFLDVDSIHGHAFSRDGKKLYLPQDGGLDVPAHNRIRTLDAAGPGQLQHAPEVRLSEDIRGWTRIARSAGGRIIFAATAEIDAQQSTIAKLHVLDPASGSLVSHLLPIPILQILAFETGAALFADGFESGSSAAWDGEFP